MQRRMTPVEVLARTVAEAESRATAELDCLKAARRKLLDRSPRPARRVEWARNGAWGLAGAALAVAVILFAMPRTPAFECESGATSGTPSVGAPLRAGLPGGASLRFFDGSTVRLHQYAEARVDSIDSHGAHVVLRRGDAEVRVIHRPETRWSVTAGPFQVKVTGTAFSLGWDPDRQRMRIAMQEGTVSISGCSLNQVNLGASQSLEATCDQGGTTIAEASDTAPAGSAPVPPTPAHPHASFGEPAASSPMPGSGHEWEPEAPPDARPPAPGWRELAAAGRLHEAFAGAEAEGFDSLCTSASAGELLSLADAALVSRRADRARQALIALRSRFPGTPGSASAAFRLGRMAFDQGASPAEARQWFQTYLAEQPAGGLAREAWGRLIEVEQRSGNSTGAQELARRYLQQWPNGPHAPLARSLVLE